ncbi:hypothetical protein NDU88_003142, partial [Pleurodeles waltl]
SLLQADRAGPWNLRGRLSGKIHIQAPMKEALGRGHHTCLVSAARTYTQSHP